MSFEDDVKKIAADINARHFDEHGQPNRNINAAQRAERDVSELIGIAKGVVADGIVNDAEAKCIRDWSLSHPDAMRRWPVSLIYSRLQQMFADGHIDDTERIELREILAGLAGGTLSISLGFDAPTTLPLDTPPPLMCWVDETYVFTGKFAYGTRAHCAREVTERGGSVEDNVTRRTSFLVLGTFSSRDWKQTSYGRKIQRAAELRDSGFALRIVGEDHWANALSAGLGA
ncbi:MAG TPA: BRCT domain-containing protein [Burkholderiales bacterium]|nr:BRCT domain-containing protein [Burkholderiales bacterium]